MAARRLVIVACLILALPGCAWFADPREELGRLGVPYSAEAFVTQAGEGDIAAVELFLAGGMPPDVRDKTGVNALTNAAAGGHRRVVEALLEAKASVDIANPEGPTPLTAAAWRGHADVVEALLEAGASVNAQDGADQTALMAAVHARRPAVVETLLQHGAHAWVQDARWSALMLASFLGDMPIVKMLLAQDANINAADDRGMTALMHGAAAGHVAVVDALVVRGAHVNAVDAGGHTALMFAANNGHLDAVRALTKAGADAGLPNRNGRRAADHAAVNGYSEIAELLRSHMSGQPPAAIDRGAPPREPQRRAPTPAPRATARDGDSWRDQERARAELRRLEHEYLRWPDDAAVFADAARTAWAFSSREYDSATGFITPVTDYPYATIWDIGSMLAALYCARELGLVDDPVYSSRMGVLLQTLARMPLYDDRVFNKAYHTGTARMVARARGSSHEWGWSTTDLGRLLVWLKIVAADPRFTARAELVVRRNDFGGAIRDGYLWGEDLDAAGRPRGYQEGSIGYEQYAALGFALWGYRADKALRLRENALPVTVMDQVLVADVRRWDYLTSEPFLLWGLEVGWDGPAAALTRRLLLAQQGRYRKTGLLTIAGEDAMTEPPHHFYYYTVYANGKAFGIETQDRRGVADGPRWVSAKSAYAFHALMPSRYTAAALQAVQRARMSDGWASGVYEATGASTNVVNVNTAAVILTAALVHERGEPVLTQALRTTSESP